ncbi:MAG: immunoglobulin domain-containing protein [Verrucomicrobiota bacterium]
MAVSGAAAANGTFTPIPVTGYTADIVVEASAPRPQALPGVTTASVDAGTANTGFTFFERGYVSNRPTNGLPAVGTTLTNAAAPDHTYKLAPDYTLNNAVLLDASTPSALVTFATPASYAGLSILGSSGQGNSSVSYEVAHQDGTTETGTITIKDWFNNTPVALNVGGRVNLDNSLVDSLNSSNPRLYSSDIALTNNSPVTSITFNYLNVDSTSEAIIFAISGGSGVVPPVFSTDPASAKISPGETATLTAVAAGTPPITLQWQRNVNGTWQNVTDGGNISGATTDTLTITAATEAQGGDYRVIATNTGGSTPSAAAKLTVLSSLSSVTTPTDSIAILAGSTPNAESVEHAIDQSTQKYLNFDADAAAPFVGPVGFTVSPSQGRTIVTVLRFYTANDAPERDPIDYTFEGSNDGTTWTLISSGPLSLPDDRNQGGAALDPVTPAIEQVTFQNTKSYVSYRVSFNHVKNDAAATAMQIGEVELLGVLDNSGAPFFSTQPVSTRSVEGTPAQFTAVASGTPVPNIRWYRSVNGVATPLTNGGNISGADTGNLNFSTVGVSDAGSYLAVASNSSGSITSSIVNLTVISALEDVTTPSDTITSFGDESGAFWGDSTNVSYMIDNTTTKYVNGGSGFSAAAGFPPFQGPVGAVITPSIGSTIIHGIRIYTADGNPERDPASYKLEGSTDGTTFSVISSGTLSLPTQRNAQGEGLDPLTQGVQEVLFANNAAYTSYRLTFSDTRDNTTASALQVAEIELLGAAGTSGPSLSVSKNTDGTITITSSQPGTLQSTSNLLNTGTDWTDVGPINGSTTVPTTGKMRFFRVTNP